MSSTPSTTTATTNTTTRVRVAFKMKLKDGQAEEYQRRHDAIWPELKELLKQSGIQDYSIFLDPETNILFAFHKLERDATAAANDLGSNPVVQKWWTHMADIMETNADHSPVTAPLKEVFYMP